MERTKRGRSKDSLFSLPMLSSILRCCGSPRSGGSLSFASALSRACSTRHCGLEVTEIRSRSRPYSSSKWEAAASTTTKKERGGDTDDDAARALAALVAALLRSSPGADSGSAAAALSSQLRPAERRHLMAALAGAELRSAATDAVVVVTGEAGAGGGSRGGGEQGEQQQEEASASSSPPPSSPALPLASPDFPRPPSSYVDAIFDASDTAAPKGTLDKRELSAALAAHDAAGAAAAASAASPLSARTLSRIALAVGLPFVGFGFVDNFVMLLAGEEIEAVFGARFGLSTLAAAGLGNLVSDVAGLGLADQIEDRARRTKLGAPVVLSAADARSGAVRAARVAGSVVGVSVGCLLGLVPLLWF